MKNPLAGLFSRKIDNKTQLVEEKKSIDAPEKKSSYSALIPIASIVDGGGVREMWTQQALVYYRICAPLFTAVSMIADEIQKIKPVLWNTKKREFVFEHPVYELLKRPFPDTTYQEFINEFAVFLIVTGNNYTLLRGNVKRDPLEMVNVHPATVTLMPSPVDGYNERVLVNAPPFMDEFLRNEKFINRQWRFINNSALSEIWPTRTLNTRYLGLSGRYGMSVLTPIYYEIEQHIQAAIHNKSLLTNGGKLSLAFTTDQNLSDDAFQRLNKEIKNNYVGSSKAGSVALLDNGVKVGEFGINNKDMDFFNLKISNVNQIYNTLKIPLPLVSPGSMTYDNVAKSILMLYFYAVLPWLEKINDELSLFVLPRYDDTEDLMITYEMDKIPALAPYRMEIAKAKKDLGVYSGNELRAMLGDKLIEGLDEIYTPANLFPVGSSDDQKSVNDFYNIMSEIKDTSGKRKFSDDEIKEMAKTYGLKR